MLNIGCHLSFSKGYEAMGKEALKINANTFQFFTRNPRGGKAKDIKPTDVDKYLVLAKENGINHILAHAPYTMNAAAADEGLREFAKSMMADDIKRMEYTPGHCYNFHPGSHVGQGVEKGIDMIALAVQLFTRKRGKLFRIVKIILNVPRFSDLQTGSPQILQHLQLLCRYPYKA